MARDCFKEFEFLLVWLRLLKKYHEDNRQYSAPLASNIAGLIVNLDQVDYQHDIIVEYKIKGLKHISNV